MLSLMQAVERGDARVPIDRYDPACERIDTAIKAIWKLYREEVGTTRGAGLARKEMEEVFDEFDGLVYHHRSWTPLPRSNSTTTDSIRVR